jgi:hypothetical protein
MMSSGRAALDGVMVMQRWKPRGNRDQAIVRPTAEPVNDLFMPKFRSTANEDSAYTAVCNMTTNVLLITGVP